MSESTQAFLLGIAATLAGLLFYVCVSFAGPLVLGGGPVAGANRAASAADVAAGAPEVAQAAGVEKE